MVTDQLNAVVDQKGMPEAMGRVNVGGINQQRQTNALPTQMAGYESRREAEKKLAVERYIAGTDAAIKKLRQAETGDLKKWNLRNDKAGQTVAQVAEKFRHLPKDFIK